MPSNAVQLQFLVCLIANFPHFGFASEQNFLFYGLITPFNYNAQYQVQLSCVDECADYPPIEYQRFTPLRGTDAGIFTFTLAPLLSKGTMGAKAMKRVKVEISSVQPLGGKQRVFRFGKKATIFLFPDAHLVVYALAIHTNPSLPIWPFLAHCAAWPLLERPIHALFPASAWAADEISAVLERQTQPKLGGT